MDYTNKVVVDYVKYLQTYSLDDILYENEIEPAEALDFLVQAGFIKHLPEPYPVDVDE